MSGTRSRLGPVTTNLCSSVTQVKTHNFNDESRARRSLMKNPDYRGDFLLPEEKEIGRKPEKVVRD